MKLVHFARSLVRTPRRFIMSAENDTCNGIPLNKITHCLTEFAPTSLAESWDNVGLLVEPAHNHLIDRILLTNDLTEDVMEEALAISANLIISYHPPLFVPMKRITQSSWKERIISKCLLHNIAIYSPHTSWDVIEGGVNDWLASAFSCAKVTPLVAQKYDMSKPQYILIVESKNEHLLNNLTSELSLHFDFKVLKSVKEVDSSHTKFTIQCVENSLKKILPALEKNNDVSYFYATPQHTVDEVVRGIGRLCTLENEITIQEAVNKLKQHLGIPFVQLAVARNTGLDHKIRTIAFVAGSGGSLMKNIRCDLKVTGEASHHEVLDSIHNGTSVILTNHSNSERGFLSKFKEILESRLNDTRVSIFISKLDSDPLKVL